MGPVVQSHAGRQVGAHPADVLHPVGRVDNDQEIVGAPPVDDEVVQDAAVLPAEE